jgi:hypothetical protein
MPVMNKYIFLLILCMCLHQMFCLAQNNTDAQLTWEQHFIVVRVQMDQTANDNEFIKSWYKDAKRIEKEMMISVYPTYLFFSPDGKPAHRLEGSTKTTTEFLEKLSQALQPERQVYTLINQPVPVLHDSAVLYHTIEAAQVLKKNDLADSFLGTYLNKLQNF